ncbi:protein-lysine N-methyltransferase CG9154 [Eupeodes corollae]|uniref:protein-lysine N-methyltransferase CG9154 n=1 Tax=Eupeodes corollae TaxID=290404 RepID=UPI002491A799|nr:protein-lysine N-methyltransferase CG9154 [Eupeodes corollae]XP_055923747.1 protein-lysine N-methyltransferase CG9154 [Eupeodes corollae]
MNSLEDVELNLPMDTMSILNKFLLEKEERERKEQDRILAKTGTSSMFEEDWQLSQFWYSNNTRTALGKVVKKLLGPDAQVALLSCPSLYKTIKDMHDHVRLFEFDKRFSIFGDDFIHYDFNEAFCEPEYFIHHTAIYDIIIADPPFLSEECITKTAHIIKKLMKPCAKLVFCSGEIVGPWIAKYLYLKPYNFRPEHERNLANEFVCYANFNIDELL